MLNRVRDKVRLLGWTDTLWFIVDSLLRRASFGSVKVIKYYFVAQPVSGVAANPARPLGGTRLYVATGADQIIGQARRPPQTLQSRFDQRSRCVVAERDSQLAGIARSLQKLLQPVQFVTFRILAREFRAALQMLDDRVEGGVPVIWGTLIAQPQMRMRSDVTAQFMKDARLADAGLAAQQHHLAFTVARLFPATLEQRNLLLAAHKRRK